MLSTFDFDFHTGAREGSSAVFCAYVGQLWKRSDGIFFLSYQAQPPIPQRCALDDVPSADVGP